MIPFKPDSKAHAYGNENHYKDDDDDTLLCLHQFTAEPHEFIATRVVEDQLHRTVVGKLHQANRAVTSFPWAPGNLSSISPRASYNLRFTEAGRLPADQTLSGNPAFGHPPRVEQALQLIGRKFRQCLGDVS